jgi:hypothetical protein
MNGEERIQTREQHGANPFFSVAVCSYPFTLEPSGSVFIPCFFKRITAETGGSSLNGYEPIRTEKNGFNLGVQHAANPFFSVAVCSYPFTLEPSGSVSIACFFSADNSGNWRFKPERIRTNTNGEERI